MTGKRYEFLPVSAENREAILKMSLLKEQEHFIETIGECLEEAKQLSCWRPVGVYFENKLIGFAMYGKFEDNRVWLDRYLIDKEYQGMGHGREALKELMAKIKREYQCREIYLSLFEDNTAAKTLYEAQGFRFNGDLDTKGEKVMVNCLGLP